MLPIFFPQAGAPLFGLPNNGSTTIGKPPTYPFPILPGMIAPPALIIPPAGAQRTQLAPTTAVSAVASSAPIPASPSGGRQAKIAAAAAISAQAAAEAETGDPAAIVTPAAVTGALDGRKKRGRPSRQEAAAKAAMQPIDVLQFPATVPLSSSASQQIGAGAGGLNNHSAVTSGRSRDRSGSTAFPSLGSSSLPAPPLPLHSQAPMGLQPAGVFHAGLMGLPLPLIPALLPGLGGMPALPAVPLSIASASAGPASGPRRSSAPASSGGVYGLAVGIDPSLPPPSGGGSDSRSVLQASAAMRASLARLVGEGPPHGEAAGGGDYDRDAPRRPLAVALGVLAQEQGVPRGLSRFFPAPAPWPAAGGGAGGAGGGRTRSASAAAGTLESSFFGGRGHGGPGRPRKQAGFPPGEADLLVAAAERAPPAPRRVKATPSQAALAQVLGALVGCVGSSRDMGRLALGSGEGSGGDGEYDPPPPNVALSAYLRVALHRSGARVLGARHVHAHGEEVAGDNAHQHSSSGERGGEVMMIATVRSAADLYAPPRARGRKRARSEAATGASGESAPPLPRAARPSTSVPTGLFVFHERDHGQTQAHDNASSKSQGPGYR